MDIKLIKTIYMLTKGKEYVIKGNDFDYEFTHGKTIHNKVISNEGTFICDLSTVKRLKIQINEK